MPCRGREAQSRSSANDRVYRPLQKGARISAVRLAESLARGEQQPLPRRAYDRLGDGIRSPNSISPIATPVSLGVGSRRVLAPKNFQTDKLLMPTGNQHCVQGSA